MTPRFRAQCVDGAWKFVLPLPPSNNELVVPIIRKGRAVLVKSKQATEWVERVLPIVRSVQCPRIEGPVQWWLTQHVSNIARDCSNGLKQLEDVVKGICWNDDLQVVELHAKKAICKAGDERVILVVSRCLADAETSRRITKSKAGR